MELKKQFQESKQLIQKKIDETAARIKQQTMQTRENLRLKLDEELRLKKLMVKEERERSVQIRSARDQTGSFPEQTVEGVRKMKEQLKKRKQETEVTPVFQMKIALNFVQRSNYVKNSIGNESIV